MSLFVESIKFVNGTFYNLSYHQARMDGTRQYYFPDCCTIPLEGILKPPSWLTNNQLYKCRVIYSENIIDIVFEQYHPRQISQYYLVNCPENFDYSHKTADRAFFDAARQKLKTGEDYIYIKNGLITDTSYANIVFTDGENYYTPAKPLLKGTKRAFYLESGSIVEAEIKVGDLRNFTGFKIINAMLDLEDIPAFSCCKLLLSHNQLKL